MWSAHYNSMLMMLFSFSTHQHGGNLSSGHQYSTLFFISSCWCSKQLHCWLLLLRFDRLGNETRYQKLLFYPYPSYHLYRSYSTGQPPPPLQLPLLPNHLPPLSNFTHNYDNLKADSHFYHIYLFLDNHDLLNHDKKIISSLLCLFLHPRDYVHLLYTNVVILDHKKRIDLIESLSIWIQFKNTKFETTTKSISYSTSTNIIR